jgi:copper resistance protein C
MRNRLLLLTVLPFLFLATAGDTGAVESVASAERTVYVGDGPTLELRHLELRRTQPPADSVVSQPPVELRLFFSEAPRMDGTRVQLADAEGDLVPATPAEADEEDASQVFVRFEAPLPDGEYTAHWRTIARDGHAQNGSFSFRVEEG